MSHLCDTSTLICTAHFPSPSSGWMKRLGDGFEFEVGVIEYQLQ